MKTPTIAVLMSEIKGREKRGIGTVDDSPIIFCADRKELIADYCPATEGDCFGGYCCRGGKWVKSDSKTSIQNWPEDGCPAGRI